MPFTLYVALGDSMTTDHYPTCDVRNLDAPPGRLDPLGAGALLHSNDDTRWPEFRGRDLARLHPAAEFLNLAEDGAMIDDVATEELSGSAGTRTTRGSCSPSPRAATTCSTHWRRGGRWRARCAGSSSATPS